MTMSRRGARAIEIDGRRYRWKLNAESPDTLALLVEPEEGKAFLWAQLPGDLYYGSITPRLVEEVVVAAIALGWDPEASTAGQRWRWEGGGLRRVS